MSMLRLQLKAIYVVYSPPNEVHCSNWIAMTKSINNSFINLVLLLSLVFNLIYFWILILVWWPILRKCLDLIVLSSAVHLSLWLSVESSEQSVAFCFQLINLLLAPQALINLPTIDLHVRSLAQITLLLVNHLNLVFICRSIAATFFLLWSFNFLQLLEAIDVNGDFPFLKDVC